MADNSELDETPENGPPENGAPENGAPEPYNPYAPYGSDEPQLDDDWPYTPDPDDDPSQRHVIAEDDARALTIIAVFVSAVAVAFCGILALIGVPGMAPLTGGLAVGSAVATVNLRILARASWVLFQGQAVNGVLGFGASFVFLVGTSVWMIRYYPAGLSGFGIGLALPGAAGLVYAVRAAGRAKPRS